MVDKNDALFREVDEELRREQFAKLWERYGIYIIALAVVLVAIVAGAKFWESQRLATANATGARFESATQLAKSGKNDLAAKAYAEIAADGPSGYAALASLGEAGSYLRQDKRKEALAVFERLASDSSTDRLLADFARLQAAAIRLDEADFTEMENRLKPLTGDESSWRFTARELLGMAALKAGKREEARTLLTPLLSDPGLPGTARERIDRLMGELAASELSSAAPKAPAAPAPTPDAATPPAATSPPPAEGQPKTTPAP